jgi:hypothetical protein
MTPPVLSFDPVERAWIGDAGEIIHLSRASSADQIEPAICARANGVQES